MWLENSYSSLNITLDSEGEESDDDKADNQSGGKGAEPVIDLNQSDDEDGRGQSVDLGYLVGDVTRPQNTADGDAIIVHCVGKPSICKCIFSGSPQSLKKKDIYFFLFVGN
jgi:hypothetical protein